MASAARNNQEIEKIFNRLRMISTNKTCFDCNAKNPTWASVTYGVFICFDCSAVHRSLGVHLTFVRSTNLDTNWTWQQVRQMQIGGNANASQFFRQHNCHTTDAQQKYNSRAAQLYRDKLAAAAAQKHDTNVLELDEPHVEKMENENNKQEDFFAECDNDSNFVEEKATATEKKNNNMLNELIAPSIKNETQPLKKTEDFGAPSVDLLNSMVMSDVPKSTIGVRKIQPKRTGLGGKKGGLGATKVKTNFADMEQKANMSDYKPSSEKALTIEQEMEIVESVRLAYQDLSFDIFQKEEKLKHTDPAKAKQMERLGMGFNVRGGVSHSAITDMKTIEQEFNPKLSTSGSSSNRFDRESSRNDSYDEYSTPMYNSSSLKNDEDLIRMGFETIDPIDKHSSIRTMFSPSQPSSKGAGISQQPGTKVTKGGREYKTYENDEAQKKFGNTKAISSDQFFGSEQNTEERATNLTRFQGSNSISSSDYFDDGTISNRAVSRKNFSNVNFNAPDLDDVKESVRQGVTKVAGRLSSIASDVMTSIQDKYGY